MSLLPKKRLLYLTLLIISTVYLKYSLAQEIKTKKQTTYVEATVPEDRDHDGIPDWWEIQYGFDHTDPRDAMYDPDNDGLTNLQEYLFGTNPLKWDTDGDGISDYDELFVYKTDPNRVDTDGDGISDYDEIFIYKTNPNAIDSDYDGLTDYEEIFIYKTNPLKWDTDDGGMSDGNEILNGTNPLYMDDDYLFVWTVYYGNEDNDLFKSLNNYKIDIFEGMNLTLEAIKPKEAKTLSISFDDKGFETDKEFIKLKIISPKKPGIYTLKLELDLVTGKKITLHRFIEIKQKGKVTAKVNGVFNSIYNKFDYFEDKILQEAKIETYRLNSNTNENELFKPKYFDQANPQYTNAEGKYLIAMEEGTYLIKISKPQYGEKEILFSTNKAHIYSENIDLIYNYDLAIWLIIFTGIFTVVYAIVTFIEKIREIIRKMIENRAMRKYIYRNG